MQFELTDDALLNATKQKSKIDYSTHNEGTKEYERAIEAELNAEMNEGLPKPKNRIIKASDLAITAPKWLIKGVLPEHGLLEVFGASGSLKSFIVLDMLFCIASGIEYHGMRTQSGAVVYVAGEGGAGLRTRLKALEIKYGIDLADIPFYTLPMPSDLSDRIAIDRLSEEIKEIHPDGVAITVFDTLHRNSGATDENSASDFALIQSNIDNYLMKLSSVVGWVHHTGLSSEAQSRGRGTSSRYASCDTVILIDRVDKSKHKARALVKCTKQKEADEFLPMLFDCEEIGLGIFEEEEEIDNFGILEQKEIISLAPKMVEGEQVGTFKKSKLKNEHHELVNCLRLVISKSGRALSDEVKVREHIKEGRSVSVSEWKDEAMKIIHSSGDSDPKKVADAKNKAFTRRKKDLLDEKIIGEYDGIVWINGDCVESFWHGANAQS